MAGLAAAVAIAAAVGFLLLPWSAPTTPTTAIVSAPVPVALPPSPAPAAPTGSTRPASSCPGADRLLTVFADARPQYGTGARATSRVRCAGGFAVMSLRSSTTPDGLQTIFAVGPPVRFLNAGTGPICTDGGSDEGTVVPRSAAAKLGCLTSTAATATATSTSTSPPRAAGPARSAADPYGCLAERTAQDRAYAQGRLMPNSELVCNYNYGPTLPSTREQCWMADRDRNASGFIDDRARRDFETGCSRFGY